jgi:hypothetical protein
MDYWCLTPTIPQRVTGKSSLQSVTNYPLSVMVPDSLLSILIERYSDEMIIVLSKTVARLRGATNASTIKALRLAGASDAAALLESIL